MSVLGPGEALKTERLTIRAAVPSDFEDASSWLETSLQPEWHFEDFTGQVEAGNAVKIEDLSEELIGAAIVLCDQPQSGCASIPFISIVPARRFAGLGGEAGIAIEKRLRRAGYECIFAPVPDGRGLAVYFWLRLGFRALLRSDAPWPLPGLDGGNIEGIWMVRDRD